MPESFVNFNIETDPDELVDRFVEYLQAAIPGWEPSPGHFEFILTQAWALIAAEVRDIASLVPVEIFKYFGSALANLPALEATRAVGNSTWTMIDDAGYTIPSGTLISLPASGNVDVLFETTVTVVVPPGSTATAAGEVGIVALEAGVSGNGLSGDATLADPLAFVDTVTVTGTTQGGQDAEATSEYLDRLRETLALQAPRPIVPHDFEVMARSVAGVERALALDNYDPSDGTFDNERMVTVVPIDAAGQPVSTSIKNAVDALLQANREANFVVHIMDPTYTEIDVTFSGVCYADFDAAEVEAACEQAVAGYLDPASWGKPRQALGENTWLLEDTVRYLEIASVINQTEGFHYITSLTINGGTSDVSLAGDAPLPTVGTVAGTVSAP